MAKRLTITNKGDGYLFEQSDGKSWYVLTTMASLPDAISEFLPGEYVRVNTPDAAREPEGGAVDAALSVLEGHIAHKTDRYCPVCQHERETIADAREQHAKDREQSYANAAWAAHCEAELASLREEREKPQPWICTLCYDHAKEREGERVVDLCHQLPSPNLWDVKGGSVPILPGVHYAIRRVEEKAKVVRVDRREVLSGSQQRTPFSFYSCPQPPEGCGHTFGSHAIGQTDRLRRPDTCPNCDRELDWSDLGGDDE